MGLTAIDTASLRAAYDDLYALKFDHCPKDVNIAQSTRDGILQNIFIWTLCTARLLRLDELLEAVRTNEDGSIVSGIDEEFLFSKGTLFVRQDVSYDVESSLPIHLFASS